METVFLNKRALVIGGTGGIGRKVAIGLAKRGADVTVHGGSSGRRLDSTLEEIEKAGGKGKGFLLPIQGPSAADEILRLFALPGTAVSVPDILVCAWGPFKQENPEKTGREIWQTMTDTNLVFPGTLVSLCLQDMITREWGRILLFGGTNTDTIRGFLTTTAYSAAKTALGVIAKSVAKAAGGRGVTCNVICPGLTDTEYCADEQLRYNRDKSPAGKPLLPAEVAAAALSVLENPVINGAIVPVDRGLTI